MPLNFTLVFSQKRRQGDFFAKVQMPNLVPKVPKMTVASKCFFSPGFPGLTMSDPASVPTADSLASAKCVPCEGGVPKLTPEQSAAFGRATPDWKISEDAIHIRRKLNCKTFSAAVERINQIAEIAEAQQHHPDLHLTGYRHLEIVLTTHAIGGLSENDFILAAQIDMLLKEIA